MYKTSRVYFSSTFQLWSRAETCSTFYDSDILKRFFSLSPGSPAVFGQERLLCNKESLTKEYCNKHSLVLARLTSSLWCQGRRSWTRTQILQVVCSRLRSLIIMALQSFCAPLVERCADVNASWWKTASTTGFIVILEGSLRKFSLAVLHSLPLIRWWPNNYFVLLSALVWWPQVLQETRNNSSGKILLLL